MRWILFLALVPVAAFAQTTVIGGGGSGPCVLSGSQTSGYVLTATDSGTGCDWESVGGASVDATTAKNAQYCPDTSVSANAITCSTTTTFPTLAAGQLIRVKVANTNTGATTIAVSGGSSKAVTKFGNTALAAGNLVASTVYLLAYDGTEWQVVNPKLLAADIPTLASTALSDSSALVRTSDTASVTNTMLAGSIANGKLANSSVTVAGKSVALGASATVASTDLSDTAVVVRTSDTGSVTNTMLAGSIGNAKLSNSATTVNGSTCTLGSSCTPNAPNLSGTPALPNGTTATTQSAGAGDTKLATDAYADTAATTAASGKVATSRTVNGHALSADVTVTASDVAAIPATNTLNYYVCGKSNGSTCASTDANNTGWNGNSTASPTISDSNACTTVAAPCRTLGGVFGKLGSPQAYVNAVVNIWVADTANTGTDCYAENNSTLNTGSTASWTQALAESATAQSYPPTYIYIYGNTSTPPTVAGNGCGVTTVGNQSALTMAGRGAVRIRGLLFEGYAKAGGLGFNSMVNAESGVLLYFEDSTCTGPGSSNVSGCVASYGRGTVVRLGGTVTVSGVRNGVAGLQGGVLYTWGPLATSSANTTFACSNTTNCVATNETGSVFTDRWTYGATGTITNFLSAYLGGMIQYTEAYAATDCPTTCVTGTLNATMTNFQYAAEGGQIDADCLDFNEGSCTVTQQPTHHSRTQTGGWARVYAASGGNTKKISASDLVDPGGCVYTFTGNQSLEGVNCNGQVQTFTGSTSGSAAISVAAAAGSPAQINLPTTTGANLSVLMTDGSTPQQTSWQASSGTGNIARVTGAVIAPTSVNGLTITTSTGTLTIPNLVVLTGPAASGTAMTLGNTETVSGDKTFTGAVDGSGASSFKTKVGAGSTSSANGAISYDSTQNGLSVGNGVSGAGYVERTLSVQTPASDTVVCNGTNELALATTYTVPANFFITGKVLRWYAVFQTVSGSGTVPTMTAKTKLGTTAIVTGTAATQAVSITRSGFFLGEIVGTAAASGSASLVGAAGGASSPVPWNTANTVSQPVAGFATNGTLSLNFSVTCSATGTGTNSVQLLTLRVAEAN